MKGGDEEISSLREFDKSQKSERGRTGRSRIANLCATLDCLS